MPPPRLFAAFMDAAAVSNNHHIIVYGQPDCMFLHRAWYQLGAMGHDYARLHVLGGSLAAWQQAAGPVETGTVQAIRVQDLDNWENSNPTYQAMNARNVVDMEEMKRIIVTSKATDAVVVDVR